MGSLYTGKLAGIFESPPTPSWACNPTFSVLADFMGLADAIPPQMPGFHKREKQSLNPSVHNFAQGTLRFPFICAFWLCEVQYQVPCQTACARRSMQGTTIQGTKFTTDFRLDVTLSKDLRRRAPRCIIISAAPTKCVIMPSMSHLFQVCVGYRVPIR